MSCLTTGAGEGEERLSVGVVELLLVRAVVDEHEDEQQTLGGDESVADRRGVVWLHARLTQAQRHHVPDTSCHTHAGKKLTRCLQVRGKSHKTDLLRSFS